ncbi:hypothetical protein [Paraoerskovia sediminicola]|nr:hypothetical protein [Paraoerskovia sediminicola]
MSWTTRYGARTAISKVTPGWVSRAIVIALTFSVAVAAVTRAVLDAGGAIDWWPFTGPPPF